MRAMSLCFPIANDLHRVTVSEEKKARKKVSMVTGEQTHEWNA